MTRHHNLPSSFHTLHGDMRLFILIFGCFIGIAGSFRCIYPVRTRTVQPGGSVTIPCSYFTTEDPEEDVNIVWGETNGEFCTNVTRIFTNYGNVIGKYKGRLHREKDPNKKRMESITITELEATDGPLFCCRLYSIKSNSIIKGNTQGTLLQFPDKEYVTQPDELIAVSGEEVIIPCSYSMDTSDITHVIWSYTDNTLNFCSPLETHTWTETYQHGRYSLVNFNKEVSLHIQNIQVNDQKQYCCNVSTEGGATITKQPTKLIVTDYRSSWDQPTKKMTVQEGQSVILNCSHTISNGRYTERNVMRVNVYWRVGNVTGPYAYHPYQDMVHSTYIHRTSITGMTNLMINGVTKADNTSFHCFVVVKLCVGENRYEDDIEYGGGTRLIINDSEDPPFLIVIVVSSLSVLIILIVVLILLKVKGVICKRKPHFPEQQMDIIQAAGDETSNGEPNCKIPTMKLEDVPVVGTDEEDKRIDNGQMEDGDDGDLLYAKLNKAKLKDKRPAELPKQNEEVIYAAVVNTTYD